MQKQRKTKAPDTAVSQKSDRIIWHPAFVEALRMELEQYLDALDFLVEEELAGAPLKIDVVIIKKIKDIVIEKKLCPNLQRP